VSYKLAIMFLLRDNEKKITQKWMTKRMAHSETDNVNIEG